jgi:apolipoprotein N-acyltransferase
VRHRRLRPKTSPDENVCDCVIVKRTPESAQHARFVYEKSATHPKMPQMNDDQPTLSDRRIGLSATLSVALLWIAQPPWMLWPLAMVALVPWLRLATTSGSISKRGYLILWAVSTMYWLLSLQGLRHAHPVIYLCWIALAAYLAIFHVLFVAAVRKFLAQRIPLIVAAPVAWVGQECIRNYLLTGISAVMLGHSMADVPLMIQIADLFGTYGVSFVLVMVNVAAFSFLSLSRKELTLKRSLLHSVPAAVVIIATISYGTYRQRAIVDEGVTTFALVQRNETVEYGQQLEQEVEMFQNYAKQSVNAARESDRNIDAFVWPESMFSGGTPWMIADKGAKVPPEAQMNSAEFQRVVSENRNYFLQRARFLQDAISATNSQTGSPHLLVGCGVVHYKQDVRDVYSGVVSINPDGSMDDWYGKTHLVMFGEYVPIVPSIPGLSSLVPPELGLQSGPGAKRFTVGDASIAPNICIESAVERVAVNQLASLLARDAMPDLIVTVTNDGWFDDSSVIDHHLRCAQLVAVGCRRPILSAANNGPTAWIDSSGQIVDRMAKGINGTLIATPHRDQRKSLYLRIGDWPARLCVLFCGIVLAIPYLRKKAS